jgi:DNA topoisomerase VI subunit B
MPKILQNRSSKTLTAQNLENIKNAIQVIIDNLAPHVVITDDDFESLAKMGTVLKKICDAVLEVVEEHNVYLETEQPLVEVQKDKAYYEQIEEIRKMLRKLIFLLDREQGVAGAEYRNAIHNYEGNVKEKVKKGSNEAQLVLDKLNRIERGTKEVSPTPPVPPTPK